MFVQTPSFYNFLAQPLVGSVPGGSVESVRSPSEPDTAGL